MRRNQTAAVIGVLFIVAALLVGAIFLLDGCGGGSVKVPNVRRLSLAEAKRALAEQGLKAKVTSELMDDQVPRGYVVEQKPAAGETVDSGTEIGLAISAGSSGVVVPSVLGKDAAQAKTELNELGLQVRVEKISSSEPSGTVINQSPGAGASVTPDSFVEITVAANFDRQSQTASPTPAPPVNTSPASGVVVIDPGHQAQGNNEPEPVGPGSSETKAKVASGATGVSSGTPEYIINMKVAAKLRDYLQGKGVKVIMTRSSNNVNISNSERAKIANKAGAKLFVRIHCNSADSSSVQGMKTFYPPNSGWTTPIYAASSLAATMVEDRAAAASHFKNLGTGELAGQTGFNWSKVPAITVEMGFLSNSADDRMLNSSATQSALGRGIGEGVVNYLQRAK